MPLTYESGPEEEIVTAPTQNRHKLPLKTSGLLRGCVLSCAHSPVKSEFRRKFARLFVDTGLRFV